jgi:PPM family protein phosphatase
MSQRDFSYEEQWIEQSGPISIRYQAASDKGQVRANNEDSLILVPELKLFGVCDGLGGHVGGEVASSMAARLLSRELDQGCQVSQEQALLRAILETNQHLTRYQIGHPEVRGMGTTVTCLWLSAENEPIAWGGHVGDSRLYRFREGNLEQLSVDHSPVYRLYQEGQLTREGMRSYPLRHLIDQCLGHGEQVLPDIFSVPLVLDDLFLLCTDGLTETLSDSDIAVILRDEATRSARLLIEEANRAGGPDNITVVLLQVTGAKR